MNLREFQKRDTEQVLSTLCAAFQNDGLYAYFIEDPGARARFLRAFMRFRLKYGLKAGTVWVTDGCEGVLILIKPNQVMSPKHLLLYGGLSAMLNCTSVQRDRIMRFNSFADSQCERYIQQPFWHVSPICVSPEAQGKGLGSALLRCGLDLVRASGQPCYLETQSAKNLPFYEACGFVQAGQAEVPGSGLISCSMIFRP